MITLPITKTWELKKVFVRLFFLHVEVVQKKNNQSFLLRHVSNTTSWYNLVILMNDDGLGRVH